MKKKTMITRRILLLLFAVLVIFGCNYDESKIDDFPISNRTGQVALKEKNSAEVTIKKKLPSELKFVANGDFGSASIYLKNEENKYFIKGVGAPGIHEIDKEEYKSNNIPINAEVAGSCFYAGLLQVFYVTKINENLLYVFYAWRDEMEMEPLNYELIKKIDLSKEPVEELKVPFYIINTAAVKTEQEAEKKVNALKEEGYRANYLWIPDYASLSGAKYFTVFIGPFETKHECAFALDDYHYKDPNAYGTLVSHMPGRVTVGGSN